eukprot:14862724-Alexandrium_andersonii.AAC.1
MWPRGPCSGRGRPSAWATASPAWSMAAAEHRWPGRESVRQRRQGDPLRAPVAQHGWNIEWTP